MLKKEYSYISTSLQLGLHGLLLGELYLYFTHGTRGCVSHGTGQDILKMIYIGLSEVKRKFSSLQARKFVSIPNTLFRLQIVMVNWNKTHSQYVITH